MPTQEDNGIKRAVLRCLSRPYRSLPWQGTATLQRKRRFALQNGKVELMIFILIACKIFLRTQRLANVAKLAPLSGL